MILYGITGWTEEIFGRLNSFSDRGRKIDKKTCIFWQLRQ